MIIKNLKILIKDFLISENLFLPSIRLLYFDLIKLKTRLWTQRMKKSYLKKNKNFPTKLHLGCGTRKIKTFLNIDIVNSEINIDFAGQKLPFENDYFEIIVSQHVIEHLDLKYELEPLFKELHRILKKDGFIYLSCPSIKKICESYVNNGCETLIEGKKRRFSNYSLDGYPNTQIVNQLFNEGSHKNLFDYELLSYSLNKCGFKSVVEIDEKIFLDKLKNFPKRMDDEQTLYIYATKY